MKQDVKQYLRILKSVTIMLKRNSIMLDVLAEDWQKLFEGTVQKFGPICDLKGLELCEVKQELYHLLSQVPTYYNSNSTVLYKDLNLEHQSILKSIKTNTPEGHKALEEVITKHNLLEKEYTNYEKQKTSFDSTLNSMNALKVIIEKGVKIKGLEK